MHTYQIEDALRMILILGAFGVEQKAFACLDGVRSVAVSNILRLLVVDVGCEVSLFNWGVAKPEILFGWNKTPAHS